MKFKLWRIPVSLSYPLLCLVAVCAVTNLLERFAWSVLAIVIHESGHLAAMLLCGFRPDAIRFSLFEIVISDPNRALRTLKQNIFIIFFGPFANFICFIVGYLLYLKGISVMLPFFVANISVGLFNSLPVLSLDGGQLLYLLLCRKTDSRRAEKLLRLCTVLSAVPLLVLGILLMIRSQYNFSLLFLSVYLILAAFYRGNRYY